MWFTLSLPNWYLWSLSFSFGPFLYGLCLQYHDGNELFPCSIDGLLAKFLLDYMHTMKFLEFWDLRWNTFFCANWKWMIEWSRFNKETWQTAYFIFHIKELQSVHLTTSNHIEPRFTTDFTAFIIPRNNFHMIMQW